MITPKHEFLIFSKILKVGEETEEDEDEVSRKVSSSSGEDSAIGSDLKPNNPFASPDGGGYGFGEMVNPFDGMTGKNNSEIPSVDEADSFEGRIFKDLPTFYNVYKSEVQVFLFRSSFRGCPIFHYVHSFASR